MMDKPPAHPEKSNSFVVREEKPCRPAVRNLSMRTAKSFRAALRIAGSFVEEPHARPPIIEEEGVGGTNSDGEASSLNVDDAGPDDLASLSQEIDEFLASIAEDDGSHPQAVPEREIGRFAALLEKEVESILPGTLSSQEQGGTLLLESISRASAVIKALQPLGPSQAAIASRIGAALQRCMTFLEEELRLALEDTKREEPTVPDNACIWIPPRSKVTDAQELTATPEQKRAEAEGPDHLSSAAVDPPTVGFPQESMDWIGRLSQTMVCAGYTPECTQAFAGVRRVVLEAALAEHGLTRTTIEEVQKLSWDALEKETATWVSTFRHFATVELPRERGLCDAILSKDVAALTFAGAARGPILQLLTFAEAVALTRRSAEKLFKLLDVYEALRELSPVLCALFSYSADATPDQVVESEEDACLLELEVQLAMSLLEEHAVMTFSDLENSIRADTGKATVPGGSIHPLTRFIMNYVEYAFEYKKTLEHAFEQHHHRHNDPEGDNNADRNDGAESPKSQFAAQLLFILDLLDSSLETKSKLYKDLSLSYIFLMNNGRYIYQKARASPEVNDLLGSTWYRKRSTDLRHYHKSYQRETWSRVLACLRGSPEEAAAAALGGKGATVSKSTLKERLKGFNAMFEEIHRTQSGWVVCDDQMQSELRVSVSAVVVPAYRSFLGKFRQVLDGGSGRGADKYIKFGPEELEGFIEDLFSGSTASIVKRR